MEKQTILEYLRDKGVTVDLTAAYKQEGDLLESEDDVGHTVPQGLSRSILDAMQKILPSITPDVPHDQLNVEGILKNPAISEIEGDAEDKKFVVHEILRSASEAVAGVMWKELSGQTIDETYEKYGKEVNINASVDAVTPEGDLDETYYLLYEQMKKDFGIADQ